MGPLSPRGAPPPPRSGGFFPKAPGLNFLENPLGLPPPVRFLFKEGPSSPFPGAPPNFPSPVGGPTQKVLGGRIPRLPVPPPCLPPFGPFLFPFSQNARRYRGVPFSPVFKSGISFRGIFLQSKTAQGFPSSSLGNLGFFPGPNPGVVLKTPKGPGN